MTKNANMKKDVPRGAASRVAAVLSVPPKTDKGVPELSPEEVDAELEDALEQTFPASDPIAMESTLVPGRRH